MFSLVRDNIDVTETGCKSQGPVLGTRVISAVFQTSETVCCVKEKLINLAKTGPSSSVHVLYIQNGIPSGPGDVDLTLLKTVVKKWALNGTNDDKSPLPKLCRLSSSTSRE